MISVPIWVVALVLLFVFRRAIVRVLPLIAVLIFVGWLAQTGRLDQWLGQLG